MLKISSPGRICLFGEHQDYLGLPVIAMAIPLYSTIKGDINSDKKVVIHKINLNEIETFNINDLSYKKPRDYFKSGIRVCMKEGLQFSSGFKVEISSQIPFNAGCGGSSSIMTSWISFLSHKANNPAQWNPQKIGALAYEAEVKEFDESGGMMDQYASAVGGLLYLESTPNISIQSIRKPLKSFILGDSQEPKDTLGILKRCKDEQLFIIDKLKKKMPDFDLSLCTLSDFRIYLDEDEIEIIDGTLKNRDNLLRALSILKKDVLDKKEFGILLNHHHQVLRDTFKVSTNKIDRMITAALDAGALGAKINGSGGGGCMFAYAPNNTKEVAQAIESVGGKVYILD